jgi:hypothetical protein
MEFLYKTAYLLHDFYADFDRMVPKVKQEGRMEIIWDVIYLTSTVLLFGLTGILIKGLAKL